MGREDESERVLEGDRLVCARRFTEAVAVYELAARAAEIPPAEICAKLARCLLETGRRDDAAIWALRVVDAPASFTAWSVAAKVIERCGVEAIPRVRRRLRVAIAGTWNTSAFVPLFRLAAARAGIETIIYETPFGQYFNDTLDATSALFIAAPEALILCPDHHAMGLQPFADDAQSNVEATVARWANVWAAARAVTSLVIVQHNFALPGANEFGHYGAGVPGSRRGVAAEINRQLAISCVHEGVGLVDVDALAARFGKDHWFDERNWHLAKLPVVPAALCLLAQHTVAVLAARLGLSRRCLVMDLDNTLWGGEIGEDGVAGITLGNGTAGEAFVDFQRAIKELSMRGIVLAVCSKNDLTLAREPFVSHPEMVLRLEDIATFAVNWRPKSENIAAIASTLNLGLDALTFIDDNPYERAEVRQALPEVDTLVLPSDPTGYRRVLENYAFFEPVSLTREDLSRSSHYQARARAESLRSSAASLEAYQASLGMSANFGPIDAANMSRVVQLINKTNQFNLTTRRRERAEVEMLIGQPDIEHFWVRLRDRFADHGLIAVVIARVDGNCLTIDTFLMSCRVIGRGLEELIRDELTERATRRNCTELLGCYIPTSRNELVADLFPRLGFTQRDRRDDGSTTWVCPVTSVLGNRSHIQIDRSGLLRT
jgi:FkbH-like protein